MKKPRPNPKPGSGYDFFGSAGYGYTNANPYNRKVFGLHNFPKGQSAATAPRRVARATHGLTAHLKAKGKI